LKDPVCAKFAMIRFLPFVLHTVKSAWLDKKKWQHTSTDPLSKPEYFCRKYLWSYRLTASNLLPEIMPYLSPSDRCHGYIVRTEQLTNSEAHIHSLDL